MDLAIWKYLLSTLAVVCAVQNFTSAQDISSRTIPINVACNGQSKYKWLNLVKPATFSQCQYTIKPYNKYVCQLKVDFSTSLGQPTPPTDIPSPSPICTDSYLTIGPYKICGLNVGQHLYIPFSSATAASEVITVVAGLAFNPTYTIRVTQIECPLNSRNADNATIGLSRLIEPRAFDTALIAPTGCAQYFTSASGVFESFNFNYGSGPYPGRMKYAICIKRPTGSTGIQFRATHFKLNTNDPMMTEDSCFDPFEATVSISSDFLYVPYSTILNTGVSAFRYCGTILEQETLHSDMFGPYSVAFNAGKYLPMVPASQRTFRILYQIV